MLLLTTLLTVLNCVLVSSSQYRITAATAWVTEPISLYPDFSTSLTPNTYLPSIFQYSYKGETTIFTCTSRNCSEVSMLPMPGLNVARFAYGGVSPRRIAQESTVIPGMKLFFSIGYAISNHNTELVICQSNDSKCSSPQVFSTADSPGFGQAGLRLTFTRPDGLPTMLIPEAKYASRDNRVTGYTVETCPNSLCQGYRTRVSLPFNLTGKADCEGTSVDVGINRLGFPTWLTLCRTELNLIHCLTPYCNQTLVNQFRVDRDWVYFAYLAVDSEYRFTITATGQTPQSDITYIRCLNPDCTDSVQSQLTIANRSSPNRSPIARVQVVIDPLTNLPVFHLVGSTYPGDVPIYTFVVCQDIECDMSKAIYVNYGGDRFGLSRPHVYDFFVDDRGTFIASFRAIYQPTNQTINAIVQMTKTDEPEVEKLRFVEPQVLLS